METNGDMKVNFKQMYDRDTEVSLVNYVAQQAYKLEANKVTNTQWDGYNDPWNFTNYTDASKNHEIQALSNAINKIFNILRDKYLPVTEQITKIN